MALATGKALQLESDLFVTGELDMIISSATVIVLDGEIYETPKNPAEASRMLQSLSGKTHQVITAVVLRYLGMNNLRTGHKFTEESAVTFSALSDALVDAYVETGEPMRHIGGYSIQGIGGSFVSGIRGCFHNVMGFPIVRFGNEPARCHRLPRVWEPPPGAALPRGELCPEMAPWAAVPAQPARPARPVGS